MDLGAFRWRFLWQTEGGELRRHQIPSPAFSNFAEQASILRQLLQTENPPGRRAVASMGGENLSLTKIEIPGKVTGKDLRDTLLFQLNQHFPLAAEEAAWDYLPLPPPPTGKDMTTPMLVVVSPKKAALSLAEFCRSGGLRLSALDADPFAFQRSLAYLGFPTAGSWGVLDLGEIGSRLIIYEDSLPILYRNLSFAGCQVRRTVTETFSLEAEAADERLLQGGVAVVRLITPLVERISAEVEETVNFYLSGNRSRSLRSLYLAGGGANLPGLSSRLEEDLRQSLSYRLETGFAVQPAFSRQEASLGPEWLLALGLALRGKEL